MLQGAVFSRSKHVDTLSGEGVGQHLALWRQQQPLQLPRVLQLCQRLHACPV